MLITCSWLRASAGFSMLAKSSPPSTLRHQLQDGAKDHHHHHQQQQAAGSSSSSSSCQYKAAV